MSPLKAIAVFISTIAAIVGIIANSAEIAAYMGVTPRQFNAARPSFVPASIWNIPDPRRPGEYGHDAAALIDRANRAREHNHFSEAIRDYDGAIRRSEATPQQKAMAYDGVSYAYLRLGRLGDARGAAEQALKLKPDSIGARIEQLKIACTAKAPAMDVSGSLAKLRTQTPGGSWQERRLERDEELFQLCAYAGVKARPLAD